MHNFFTHSVHFYQPRHNEMLKELKTISAQLSLLQNRFPLNAKIRYYTKLPS